MAGWLSLLHAPSPLDTDAWFARIADKVLNGAQLRAGGQVLRFTEIELYYHAPGHADPFSHRDPVTEECGRWYFHRTGGIYRGGSFKGFDLAFGSPGVFGGILFRGLETADGVLVDGPSRCVDYLLTATGEPSVAALDRQIDKRRAWDNNPLLLQEADNLVQRPILRCARVGLSLKRAGKDRPSYLLRPYRFLSRPREIAKGKLQMVLALHVQGKTPTEIRESTRCPAGAIARYIADFEQGQQEADFSSYLGRELSPRDLCRLHGLWYSRFGSKVPSQ